MTSPALTTPRLTCPLDAIDTSNLLRKDVGDLDELCRSIQDNLSAGLPGLIHPVVVDGQMRLLSGSRRLAAHRKLGLKEIDFAYYAVLDDAERVRVEVDANKQKLFTWQERVLGIDKYHRFYSTKAALSGESWGVRETGALLRQSKSAIGRATLIAEYLHTNDKEIWSAESMEDAYRVLIKREEEAAAKLLVAQTVAPLTGKAKPPVAKRSIADEDFFDTPATSGAFTPTIGGPISTDELPGTHEAVSIPLSSIFFKQEDHKSLTVLRDMGPACCDHIITDPPYGIDMDMLNQQNPNGSMNNIEDVAKEHDVEENLTLLREFIPLAHMALRDRGWLIFFCDPTHWWNLTCLARDAGFKVQRWPLVWHKTSSCMNQSAQYNFTKNIEFAVVARKASATLALHQKSSVYTGGSDLETKLYGHPFAKPAGLWEWLYNAVALRGAEVLDPFAGSCSSGVPAIKLGMRWRGIECSEKHYNTGMSNLMNVYKSLDPTCTFS